MPARKLTFQEAWDSTTIFFVDEALETEMDAHLDKLLASSRHPRIAHENEKSVEDLLFFLREDANGLDVILNDIGLSGEKFKRTVSLLRKIGRIPGAFTTEWSVEKIKREMAHDPSLARTIATLLLDGKRDVGLRPYVPRYYLDMLNYRELEAAARSTREIRYKDSLIGTYGARKGHQVEARIASELAHVAQSTGVGFEKGRSRFVSVDVDFAIPSLEDPWVIIMSSFQETTSSGQTTKARDMQAAYTRITESNSRYRESRAFVNFVDGGGWLARKSDLQRLVNECHYFLNLQHLDMLEAIIRMHVPPKYFHQK